MTPCSECNNFTPDPPEMLSLTSTTTLVNAGDTVTIRCAAKGSPDDIEYIWLVAQLHIDINDV